MSILEGNMGTFQLLTGGNGRDALPFLGVAAGAVFAGYFLARWRAPSEGAVVSALLFWLGAACWVWWGAAGNDPALMHPMGFLIVALIALVLGFPAWGVAGFIVALAPRIKRRPSTAASAEIVDPGVKR